MLRGSELTRALAVGAVACASLLSTSTGALAQPAKDVSTPGEKLFREGRDAMGTGDYVTACAKFKESYALEHVVTSLLNEADCEEKRGRLNTSLKLWQDGRGRAEDDAARKLCDDHVNALKPRVPLLEVQVATPDLSAVTVTLDGAPFATGVATPVDPGSHDLVAGAAGRSSETQKVQLEEGGKKTVTVLGAVASTTNNPPVTAPATPPTSSSSPVRTAGWITGGVGLAGLVLFGATGIAVLTNHDDCPEYKCASDKRPQGLLVANAVGLVVGIVGVGVGTTLVIVGGPKKTDAPKAAVDFGISPASAGVGFSARF